MEIKTNLSNPIQLHFSSAEAIFYWRRAHEWGGENNKAFLVAMKLRNWARKRNGEGWEERKEEKWRMKEKDRKRERKRNGEGKNERERKKVRKRDWGSKRAFSFFPFSRVRRSVFLQFFSQRQKTLFIYRFASMDRFKVMPKGPVKKETRHLRQLGTINFWQQLWVGQ